MARRVVRPDVLSGKVIVLDAQALSLWAEDDEQMRARMTIAVEADYIPAISAATIVETQRTGQPAQRLRWMRSRCTVVAVSEELANVAAALLGETGLSGHEYAIDAMVVATAYGAGGVAKVASSDGSHIPKLCAAASALRGTPVEWLRV